MNNSGYRLQGQKYRPKTAPNASRENRHTVTANESPFSPNDSISSDDFDSNELVAYGKRPQSAQYFPSLSSPPSPLFNKRVSPINNIDDQIELKELKNELKTVKETNNELKENEAILNEKLKTIVKYVIENAKIGSSYDESEIEKWNCFTQINYLHDSIISMNNRILSLENEPGNQQTELYNENNLLLDNNSLGKNEEQQIETSQQQDVILVPNEQNNTVMEF